MFFHLIFLEFKINNLNFLEENHEIDTIKFTLQNRNSKKLKLFSINQ